MVDFTQLNVKELKLFISYIRNFPLDYGYVTQRFLNKQFKLKVNNIDCFFISFFFFSNIRIVESVDKYFFYTSKQNNAT